MSPFVDNEEEGYLPDRQREINALAGIESKIVGPTAGSDDSASNSDKEDDEADKEEESVDEGAKGKGKGDADSSSDEGDSEELSDSESEDEKPIKKKGSTAAAKKVAPKATKQI